MGSLTQKHSSVNRANAADTPPHQHSYVFSGTGLAGSGVQPGHLALAVAFAVAFQLDSCLAHVASRIV